VLVVLRPVVLRAVARPPLRPAATLAGDLRAVDFLRVEVDFLRVPVDFRVVFLRAVARPPLRPAATTDGALRVVFLRPVDLRAVVFLRPVDLRVPVDFRVVFLRVVLRAVALPPLRPAATLAGDLRVVFLRPVDLRAVAFLRPVDLRVEVDFRVPVDLRAVLLRPVVFLRLDEDFLLAVVFRVVDLLRTGLRVERPESAPNTSDVIPPPVSIVRVVGVKVVSSEPDITTPPPTSAPSG
jgi:hypothetical protein